MQDRFIPTKRHAKIKSLVLFLPSLIFIFLQQRADIACCSLYSLWVVITSNVKATRPFHSSLGGNTDKH